MCRMSGHLRSAVAFDQLWRWLEIGHGLDVTLVRNVTDLDDKILAASKVARIPWWAWAYRNERAFAHAYQTTGVRTPTYEPRATGHIADMLGFIGGLVDAGFPDLTLPPNLRSQSQRVLRNPGPKRFSAMLLPVTSQPATSEEEISCRTTTARLRRR
ncbi:hypothetical protein [Nonomuraea sp. CA-141351]|uniref:hypothetical protein n=1 Tax=Nonomuraea sp. CA-141351 TaxID=3239996 RepID=UPI003D936924